MRFKSGFELMSREGEHRVVRKFLWRPRQFGIVETRWLEFARVREQVCKIDIGGNSQWGKYRYDWVEYGFAD